MDFVVEPRPYTDPDVVRLVAEVQAVYVEMYGSPDGAEVSDDEFVLPAGQLLVGFVEGAPVAMGGWRRLPSAELSTGPGGDAVPTAEIKRMYTVPAMQRHGLGRRMLHAVERSAASAGIERLVLNTGPHQAAAIALYESEGYRATEPFGYYSRHGAAVFLARSLARPLPAGAESP